MDLLEEELDSNDPVHGELSGDALLYQQYRKTFPYHGKIIMVYGCIPCLIFIFMHFFFMFYYEKIYTSTVISASRKTWREGNPVVSDLYILPTGCICVFRMVLAVNNINLSRSVADM
jgi:hypothetical protein